jgi:hypothetical protein
MELTILPSPDEKQISQYIQASPSIWNLFFPWTRAETLAGTELNDPEYALLKSRVLNLDLQISALKKQEAEIANLHNNALKKIKEKEFIKNSYDQAEVSHSQLIQTKILNLETKITELSDNIRQLQFNVPDQCQLLIDTTRKILEAMHDLQKTEDDQDYNLIDYNLDKSKFLTDHEKILYDQQDAMQEIKKAQEEEMPVNIELKKIRKAIAELTDKKNTIIEFINKMTLLEKSKSAPKIDL